MQALIEIFGIKETLIYLILLKETLPQSYQKTGNQEQKRQWAYQNGSIICTKKHSNVECVQFRNNFIWQEKSGL